MYHVGELVVYGSSGVCRVASVGALTGGDARHYYTLDPLYGTETIFAPVDTRVYMRPVLTKDQAEDLITGIPEVAEETLDGCSLPVVTRYYKASFETHEVCDLVRLIKTIQLKDSEAVRLGRKPGKTEEKYRKRAEELLHGELAVALGMALEQVPQYISSRLDVS